MCPPCRTRYRTYGTTKRAKWKAEREAFDREMAGLRVAEDERRQGLGLGVSLCFRFLIWGGLFLFLTFFTFLPFCVRLFPSCLVVCLTSFLLSELFFFFLPAFVCLPSFVSLYSSSHSPFDLQILFFFPSSLPSYFSSFQ